MSFCIFIASSTATTSPSLTASPGLTGILTIKPCIGAITVPSPDRGDAGLAGGAEPAAAPVPGMTVMPAPLTRTLNTSPSTSTSNSAVTGGAAAGVAGAGSSDGAGGAVLTTCLRRGAMARL